MILELGGLSMICTGCCEVVEVTDPAFYRSRMRLHEGGFDDHEIATLLVFDKCRCGEAFCFCPECQCVIAGKSYDDPTIKPCPNLRLGARVRKPVS